MLIVKMIVALIVFMLLLFFADQNYEYVNLFYGPEEPVKIPLYLLLLIALLAGMFFALFISIFDKLKLKSQLRALRKENKQIEAELNSLRTMPIMETQESSLPEDTQMNNMEKGE